MGFLDRLMGKGTTASAQAEDPVCHMTVDAARPPGGSSQHGGRTYHFCGAGCKQRFDAEPQKYAAGR